MRRIAFDGATFLFAAALVVNAASVAQAMQQPAPDNTATNKQAKKPTAQEQGQAKSDRDMTSKIRREVTKDKTLSTYAHNIKIITQEGVVTLKGPVRSQEDKETIGRIAISVAGQGKVVNEIEIVPKSDK